MSTKSSLRGAPSQRGRAVGRAPTSQRPHDNTSLSSFAVQPPSKSKSRSKGFQPAEVHNPRQLSENSVSAIHAEAIAKVSRSINPSAPSKGQNENHGSSAVEEKLTSTATDIPTQIATLDASRPDLDPVDLSPLTKASEAESSETQIITEHRPMPRQSSCWSRGAPSEAGSLAKWDSRERNIDRPTWDLAEDRKAGLSGFRADLRTLPKYKFLGTPKGLEKPTSSSFDRQMANIQERDKMPDRISRLASTFETQPPRSLQAFTNSTDAKQASNERNHDKIFAPSSETSPQFVTSKGKEDKTIIAHLKLPKTRAVVTAENAQVEDLPPHLRAPEAKAHKSAISTTALPAQEREIPHKAASQEDNKSTVATVAEAVPGTSKTAKNGNTEDEKSVSPHLRVRKSLALAKKLPIKMEEHSNGRKTDSNGAIGFLGDRTGPDSGSVGASVGALKDITKRQNEGEIVTFKGRGFQDGNGTPTSNRKTEYVDALKKFTTGGNESRGQSSKGGGHRNGNNNPRPKNGNMKTSLKKGKQVEWEPINYEPQLAGWDGKWQAAPDWDQRETFAPSFTERKSAIEAWAGDQAVDTATNPVQVNVGSEEFQTGKGIASGDGGLANNIADDAHHTVRPKDDFTDAKREQSAQSASQEFVARKTASSQQVNPKTGMTKLERRQWRRKIIKADKEWQPDLSGPHIPDANIYLRPAEAKDIRQMTEIYNRYIRDTVFTPCINVETEAYWTLRLQESLSDNSPLIVAVNMGPNASRNPREIHRKRQEEIIGFASAVDFGMVQNAYRFTVELEIWVHHHYLHQGVGKTLLDRVLAVMDPSYNLREGAPFLTDGDIGYWTGGGTRIIKTIMFTLLYDPEDQAELEWKKKWLFKENFEQAGIVPKIGFKSGKALNICQLYYETLADIPRAL